MLEVAAGGERLQLLPDKAVWWPAERTLIVADLHFGKAAAFRAHGVPVPRGTTSATLAALDALLVRWPGARRLVCLGDFLHAPESHARATVAALARWRARHTALALTLVRGNHDDRAGDPPAMLAIELADEPLRIGGLALCHHPRAQDGAYTLAGHLHPCVTLPGSARDRLRLPCFRFGPEVGVLPAFGSFTGMAAAQRLPGERVYVVADGAVVALPQAGPARTAAGG